VIDIFDKLIMIVFIMACAIINSEKIHGLKRRIEQLEKTNEKEI